MRTGCTVVPGVTGAAFRGLPLALGLLLALPLATSIATASGDPAGLARTSDPGRTEVALPVDLRLPLTFTVNQGQMPDGVHFLARRPGLEVALRSEGFDVRVPAPAGCADTPTTTLFFRFEGTAGPVVPVGVDRLPGRIHFLTGADPAAWTTDVATFRAVRYDAPWKGVDVLVRDGGDHPEYDLVIAAKADVDAVTLRLEGATALRVAPDGTLVAETPVGPLRQPPPRTWEEDDAGNRTPVACAYRLLGDGRFGFRVAERSGRGRLVVDPSIEYGTYLGGSLHEHPQAVAVDGQGMVYVAGVTVSPDFPTQSAYQSQLNGATGAPRHADAFVLKIDPTVAGAAGLVWATFLGGGAADAAVALAIDESTGSPRATIAGWTDSADFPVTIAAHGPLGARDAFLAILGTTGSTLDFAKKFGGSQNDWFYTGSGGGAGGGLSTGPVVAVAPPVDGEDAGDVPVPQSCAFLSLVGMTTSTDFPTTPNAFDASFHGAVDLFVVTLDLATLQVVYSTYVGGADREFATALAATCDTTTQRFFLYVAGLTHSPSFPMPVNVVVQPFQGSFQGSGLDPNGILFVLEPSAQGANDLRYATYLGTSTEVLALAVDSNGIAYLAGSTGPSFPQKGSLSSTVSPGGAGDGFLTLLAPNGAGAADLLCSTIVGGTDEDRCTAVLLDESRGWVYVAGRTASPTFPTVNSILPWQSIPHIAGAPLSPVDPWELHDAFLTRLPLGGCGTVDVSTFLGGTRTEEVFGMALDPAGRIWVTGPSHSRDLPVTPDGFETAFRGGLTDGFLIQIDPN